MIGLRLIFGELDPPGPKEVHRPFESVGRCLRFFELLLARSRDRLAVVVARREGRPIAATLNVVKGDAFYGRYWGCERDLPNLHFDVCYYAAIEHCIRQGIRRFEPGAGGEHKRPRGFDARPTWSLHFLADPRLARAVQEFLEREREEAHEVIDALREQSAYKPARS